MSSTKAELLLAAARYLNETLEPERVYERFHELLAEAVPHNGVIVSSFDPRTEEETGRALAYVDSGAARLVSPKGTALQDLPAPLRSDRRGRTRAGRPSEIVHLAPDGKPMFYDLMRRRTPQWF